jgi:hypothetical protein
MLGNYAQKSTYLYSFRKELLSQLSESYLKDIDGYWIDDQFRSVLFINLLRLSCNRNYFMK